MGRLPSVSKRWIRRMAGAADELSVAGDERQCARHMSARSHERVGWPYFMARPCAT